MQIFHLTAPLTPEQLADNQRVGLMPPNSKCSLYASRAHWGSFLTGVFPEEEPGGPKYWKFNFPGSVKIITAFGSTPAKFEGSYSLPFWSLYGANAFAISQLYRQYAAWFDEHGGIPLLAVHTLDEAEAQRINVSEGVTIPYPLGTYEADQPVIQMYILWWQGTQLVAAQYQEFAAARAAEAASAKTPQANPPAVATQPGAGAPMGGTLTGAPAAPKGQTNVGENSYIDWDKGGERFNRNATDGAVVGTGFRFVSDQGAIGEGGGWQNFDLTPASLGKTRDMVGGLALARNIQTAVGQTSTDLGVHEDKQLVFTRGGKTTKRDASLFADLIASRTLFTPLSTGAVEPWIAAVNTELDSVERDLES